MPIMPQYRSPYGQSIAELLMRQGEIAARGAERSGQIWGNAVQNLGQIGAQAYEQHQQKKDQQQREAMFDEAISTFDPANPQDFYRRAAVAVGPQVATQALRAFAAVEETKKKGAPDPKLFEPKAQFIKTMWETNPDWVKKNWGGIAQTVGPEAEALFGVRLGPEWSDEYGQMIGAFGADSAAPKTRQVEITNPDGSKSIKIVEDRPGQDFTSAPDPTKTDPRVVGRSLVRPDGTVIYRDPEAARAPRDEKLYEVEVPGPDGTLIKTLKTEAEMRSGVPVAPKSVGNKPVTGAERQSLAYFNRAKESTDGIEDLESRIAERSFVSQQWNEKVPNVMKSDDQQLYDQRQRAFTEARLRKESGAAIPESEFANDKRTYWAQPGDSEATIKQKRAARAKVLDGLRYSAGKAYEEYYGEPAPKAGATPNAPEAPTNIGRFKVEVVK